MTNETLDTLLEKVRQELGHADQLDEKGRALLKALDDDIHELLAQDAARDTQPTVLLPPATGRGLF